MADILCQLREESTQALLENGTAGVGGLETRELGYTDEVGKQEFSFKTAAGAFRHLPTRERLLYAPSALLAGAKLLGYFPSNGMSATDVQAALDELRASIVGIGSLGGSGTADIVPKWTGAGTLGNSTLTSLGATLAHVTSANGLTSFMVQNTNNGTDASAALLVGGADGIGSMSLYPAAYTGNLELTRRLVFGIPAATLGMAFVLNAGSTYRLFFGTPSSTTLFHQFDTKGITLRNIVLNTDANLFAGGMDHAFSLTKNDAQTRQYFGYKLRATLNPGGSNTTTTLNLMDLDTVNTSLTGLTVNLLKLAFGGTEQFRVDSAGGIWTAGIGGGTLVATGTGGSAGKLIASSVYSDAGAIGINGSPNPNNEALKVSANINNMAVISIDPTTGSPANPSAGFGRVYIKGGWLIVQYNDAGTTRYKYLDLAGTGTTFTHTTTAP